VTYLRSTYAAGDHPHATCVTFFSLPPFFLSPPWTSSSSSSSSSSSFSSSPPLFPLRLFHRESSLVFPPPYPARLPVSAHCPLCGLRSPRGFTRRSDFTNGRILCRFPLLGLMIVLAMARRFRERNGTRKIKLMSG